VDQYDTPQRGSGRTLAILAIIVALTAPWWEGPLLGSINIHMPMATALAENARALDQLDHRTAQLEQQIGAATAQLSKVQAQLAETTARANSAADRTATLAMLELVTALHRSGGFELELAALRGAMPEQGALKPLLDQIEPYAVTGVPSARRLREEFARTSLHIEWSQRGYSSVAWVMHLMPWRQAANAAPVGAPDNTIELLHQASAQLGSGDMAGATATLQTIDGAVQEALADWLEDAKARVAADAVVQRLNDQITRGVDKAPVVPKKA
jgi:hypothetical protein